MIKILFFLFLSFFLCTTVSAQPILKGPSAQKLFADNAANIDDANDSEKGTFARISKKKDYGLTITRIVVDLGEGSVVTPKDLTEGLFGVMGGNTSDKDIQNITGVSVTDHKGDSVESGRYVTIDLDFGFDSDADNTNFYIVTLNTDLGKYAEGTKFFQQGRTLRK